VDGQEGVSLARKFAFHAILCDVRMPKLHGLGLLEALQGLTTPIIMITGHGTVDTAVAALKQGAFDFIQKPLDLNRVLIAVRHAVERQELLRQKQDLERQIHENQATTIVGDSLAIRELIDMVATVAPTDARVLITGSNGVGKELVARQLHELSSRSHAPFVEVNCAAIPSELIESELFGHKKGSFTGAIADKPGLFEVADGGTLFLDEVGELPVSMQVKLLRALQDRAIRRVGGNETVKIDVRIVAATNKNLEEGVKKGTFREDLYYRLNVFPLATQALAERPGDILPISIFLLAKHSNGFPNIPEVSESAIEKLEGYAWPGNVRELENVLQRAIVLAGGQKIDAEHLMIDP
jgi:DNA-binding NtrC family response regulator